MRRMEQYYPVGLNRATGHQVPSFARKYEINQTRDSLSFDLSLLALGLLDFEVEIDDVL